MNRRDFSKRGLFALTWLPWIIDTLASHEESMPPVWRGQATPVDARELQTRLDQGDDVWITNHWLNLSEPFRIGHPGQGRFLGVDLHVTYSGRHAFDVKHDADWRLSGLYIEGTGQPFAPIVYGDMVPGLVALP